MLTLELKTDFAGPERFSFEEVLKQNKKIRDNSNFITLLNCSTDIIVILNKHRQIVMANDNLLKMLALKEEKEILGKRPGEALNCVHHDAGPEGCGTTQFCRFCGAVNAVINSQEKGERDIQECKINIKNGNSIAGFNFNIWSTPIEVEEEEYYVVSIQDITDRKYRQLIDRIFFHDVLNMAGGLYGIIQVLPDLTPDEIKDFHTDAMNISHQLISEIEAQRDLAAAERGELKINAIEFNVQEFLSALQTLYKNHPVAEGRFFSSPSITGDPLIKTDYTLLTRVMGNLLKNALEASKEGQKISITYKNTGKECFFSVNNETEMPEEVKLQLFKRYFSTKANKDRGLGTYSVKLLTEKYLKGEISFTSSQEDGTTFTVKLPPVC